MGTKKDGTRLDRTRTDIGAGILAKLLDTIESLHLTEGGIQESMRSPWSPRAVDTGSSLA